MEQVFKKLRKQDGTKTYAGELFAPRWWGTVEQKTDFSPPVESGERMEAINSLGRFVEEKCLNGQDSIRFSGGEVVSKEVMTGSSPMDELGTFEDFCHRVQACKNCKELQLGSPLVGQERGPFEVLFVGDFFRSAEQEGFFPDQNDQLLNRICLAMKLQPGEFGKSLAIKCHSGSDMTNNWKEMGKSCINHLQQEIALLRPKIVITLGAVATRLLLDSEVKLSSVHGKFYSKKLLFGANSFEFQVVPIFQLDLLMINPNMKKTAWNDLQEVMKYLGKL